MGYSKKSFNGVYIHYDDDGNETGYSKPSLNGSYDNFTKDGKQTSYSIKTPYGYETRKTQSQDKGKVVRIYDGDDNIHLEKGVTYIPMHITREEETKQILIALGFVAVLVIIIVLL